MIRPRSRATLGLVLGICGLFVAGGLEAQTPKPTEYLASWTDGCRQGREDMMTLMPLLLAQSDPARMVSPAAEKDSRP